ncbi:hypothetical protein B0I37DRAFT_358830 [Chaetomium sp. MPI-CAGE-AT-0009]|nr:hypothetical protein B0I37DRAFT_358830 [Chaetomium sp. MPI-CAGE-AT-0009]
METAALFYSANRFVIFYSPGGSFKNLRLLSPKSLASLTSLKIVLNQSCHEPIDTSQFPPYCWCTGHYVEPWSANHHCTKDINWPFHGGQRCGGQHCRPLLDPAPSADLTILTSAKREVEAMMSEWYDAVSSTSSHIGIGRLELFFVCDIGPENSYALEAAQLALAPIALFPRLKDCHVRLSEKPNHALQQIAQGAVLQACGRASPALLGPANLKIPSALTNLPPELRVRILEYTDLITPWKQVTWSRQKRGYQVLQIFCSDNGFCPPDVHNGCRLNSCNPSFGPDLGLGPHTGCCFCRARHASFSFACNCWAPPTSLFLIRRTLYRDAQFVFFSSNRFIVHDKFHVKGPCCHPDVQYEPVTTDNASPSTENYYPFERLAASEFLRDIIPTHCMAHLRSLQLINAFALTLRVSTATFYYVGPLTSRSLITQAQVDDVVDGYRCILEPLRRLVRTSGGLAGFYKQLTHPSRWTQEILRLVRREHGLLDEAFLERLHRDFNDMVEHWIRGPEGPNSSWDDPDSPGPSVNTWKRWRGVDPHAS